MHRQSKANPKFAAQANTVLGFCVERGFPLSIAADDPTAGRIRKAFSRLAADFVSPDCRAEYNSVKHGLRCRSGGFQFKFNIGDDQDEPETVGWRGSDFGASFLELIKIEPQKHNVFAQLSSFNFEPQQIRGRLLLVASFVQNLLISLKAMHGDGKAYFEFHADEDAWDSPWSGVRGLRSLKMHDGITAEDIDPVSKDQILAENPPSGVDGSSS